MAGSDRWYFSKDFLANTPSRRCGIDADKELSYRQQAANLIQDMGQRLHVSQLCINTAIVYMHRFYSFHSFTKFHRNSISSCALFLAAKVEEQPRKLEHVIKVSFMCLHRETPALDVKSEAYQEQAMELVFNENLMLQTLGFDIDVEHPHTSVVNCCQLVRASKDLAQTSYFMATNSLHLTTMCLQHKPTVVACVCIHLACKWSSWEIPRSSEGKDWFYYVDKSVTLELLEQLTKEFLAILDKCPSRLKRKILSGSGGNASTSGASHHNSSMSSKPIDEKKISSHMRDEMKPTMPSKSSCHQISETIAPVNSTLTRRSPPTSPLMKKVKTDQSNKIPVAMSYATYRERKANTHSEQPLRPQSDQSIKSNNKSLNRDIVANPLKDRICVKQQIISDKQKQSDERHKIKAKNSDYLFDSTSSRPTNTLKAISSSTHPKSSQNKIDSNDDNFYESLHNSKPTDFDFRFTEEDSIEFKNKITSELQMEFSDNSNQSNDVLNLTSFTSDFMNDSSDSKKSLNNNNKLQTTVDSKTTSFMDIFSTPITTANSMTTSTAVASKSDSVKTNIPPIPPKYEDIQSVLSRMKPEPPPPMLSPLKSTAEVVESVVKTERQSFSTHSSSAQSHLKINSSLSSGLDSKQFLNLKNPKISPKNRNQFPHKNSSGGSVQSIQSFRDKELNESLQNVKLEEQLNPILNTAPIETSINVNNNFSNNCETIASIPVKAEIIEKSLKAPEVPSVLSVSKPQITSHLELDIKPIVDSLAEPKQSLHLSPNSQMLLNNTNVASESGAFKAPVVVVKEEKHSQDEKHHKHSHHSHKSSKHKDKHKHKHKDKDREKHKRKDKGRDRDRDKDRERHREKANEVKDDPSFKVLCSSPKHKTDVSNTAPLKLKISKKNLSIDSNSTSNTPDKDNDVQQNPIKLRIQLKNQKMTANSTEFESIDSSSRKRKSSPKLSKKEKILKQELNSKLKDDKNWSKTSAKSKKSNELNSISDEKRSKALKSPINSFDQQMMIGMGGQAANIGQQPTQRLSKAHK